LEAPRIHGELRKFGFCGHLMKRRQYMINTRLVGSVVVGKSAIVEGDYCAASAISYNQESIADIDNKSTKVPCALLCRYGTGWIGTSLS
jgi:hypothetical protein